MRATKLETPRTHEPGAFPPPTPGNQSRWLTPALLAILTLAVCLPSLQQQFVDYDDSDYVRANRHVQGGLSWSGLLWAFGLRVSNWHPLTWLSHMLDCQLFGLAPWGHHLTSVLLHAANTVLVFLVLKGLTGAHWRSAIVAALFGLHPLHVESVAWISERKDVLSGFFFLLTLWAYEHYVHSPRLVAPQRSGDGSTVHGPQPTVHSPSAFAKATQDRQSRDRTPQSLVSSQLSVVSSQWSVVPPPVRALWYLSAVLAFSLGLMAKPMLVTLPFVLLLLDYWPLDRFGSQAPATNRSDHHPPSAPVQSSRFKVQGSRFVFLLCEKLPFFALSAASCVLTYLAQHKGGAVSTALTFPQRLANALISYVRYVGKTFWPLDLSVLYPHPGHWPVLEVVAAGALLLLISAAVLVLARRRPYLAVGWTWFVGMLVPVIGLVQVGMQSMADRYTYLPLIGLFILLIWGADATLGAVVPGGWQRLDQGPTRLKAGLAALVLGCCAFLTFFQIGYWRNTSTLFERAARVTSGNYLAYNNLGFYYENNGKPDLAMTNYLHSLAINPNYDEALNNVGHLLAGRRQYAEAIACYRKALLLRTNHVEIHNNLGNALSETGNIDEAIGHYLFVLSQQPDHADANNNLGIALAMKGRLEEAMTHFRLAIESKPQDAGAHLNLGNALAAQHKLPDAITEFHQSLNLNPNQAQAHNNLGNALAETGKVQEAVEQYKAALALDAEDAEAHFNFGLALLRLNQTEAAKAHLLEALRLRPGYPAAKAQLDAIQRTTDH